ncbi:hypothetical protein SARC_12410 [Sphaeroforma arctica JP610]|uniref:Enhancer of mRNA-decapping protein 4 WD40 repeat region domain-containing protein n=1 Tax=Sphaeroforma arctica JP610 TaxID=667725 RepID=A0A0L0FG91_9EUKA|nr:hypothetical protein SARC_12410 [Sphaeroforma arctica JP610]KNC75058.1 hypothetical protein SARC_12410 [Sphaeroforma arctica JP610]|eukprot:XP_014148960.1 hypothetical protein SARC_12410 [Sphaeroforma arctica JP610]
MDAADALKRMLNISSPEGGGQSPTTPQSSAAIDFTHSECSHTLPLTGGHISVVASPSSAAAQRSTSSPNNLEVMTFSLYNTAPEVYSGRLVAMNDNYVAYGVKLRAGYGVRILHRHTSQRGMVRDHLTPLVDMAFMGDTSDVLATMDQTGHVIVSAVSSGDDASADLIVMRGCHIYDEDNQHVPPQNAFSSGALAWLSCDGHGRLLVGRNGSRAYVCDVSALREAVGEQPINISAGLFNGIRYVPNISNVTAVSPNSGGTVALAGADGTVSFIDKTSLDVVAMTTAANLGLDTVDHMSFLDENHVLICGNSNSHVVLYHLQQQRELQRLSFKAPGGGMPSLYVSVDASNQYMLLSDTHEATLYVVSFAGAAEKSFSQIREFNSTLPMLSFVCAAATVGETEDMSDNAEYNQMKQETRIVVFTAQSKAMQQLTLRFPPSSTNEKAEVATNAVDQSDSEEVDGVLQQTVTALTPGAFTHDGGDNTAVGRDNSGRDIDTVIHASGDGLELEQSMSATEGIPVLTPTNIRQQSNESTPRHSHTQTPTGTITPTPLPEQPVLPSLDAPGAQGRDRSTDHLVVASNSPPQVHVAATQDKAHAHTQQLQGVTQPIQKQSHGGNSPSQAHARAHEHVNAIANANAGAQPQIQILKRGEDAGQVTAAATHSPPPKSESIRLVHTDSRVCLLCLNMMYVNRRKA